MPGEPAEVFRVSTTEPVEGDGRIPKQYCQLLGSRTMLEHTLARLNQLTPASRTLTVIGTDHKPYAMPQLLGASDHVWATRAHRDGARPKAQPSGDAGSGSRSRGAFA
jgi:hypothetical protein